MLIKALMRSSMVVVRKICDQHATEMPLADDQDLVEALLAHRAIQRSATAFAFGARTGVRMIVTSSEVNTVSKAAENLVSWS